MAGTDGSGKWVGDMSEARTPGDLVADALTWLEQNPEAPVADKACMAVVVASGGVDRPRTMTYGDLGEIARESGLDIKAGLESVYDRATIKGTDHE